MNSLQGGWGIQDRHDRVISWLSAIVVSLLVLYALIFFGRQVMPASGPRQAGLPTASATPREPLPPVGTRAPTSAPPVTRRAPLPTRRVRLPEPTPRATRTATLPPVTPTRRPEPSRLPAPTAVVSRLPIRPPTQAPVATQVPTPRATPAASPDGERLYVVRVGEAFASGMEALSFVRQHELSRIRLTPVSEEPGAPLFLDAGPYRTQDEAFREMTRMKARIGDPDLRMLIRPAGQAAQGGSSAPATRAPAPTRSPLPTRAASPTRSPAPTRVAPPTPTSRVLRPPPTTRIPPPSRDPLGGVLPTRRPVASTRPVATVRPPPTRPVATNPGPAVDVPTMSVDEAREILRTRYSWSPPAFTGYTLQVSSFRTLVNAVNFQEHLQRKGYQAHLEVVDLRGAWFRIMVDRYDTLEEARGAADLFQQRHGDIYQVFVRKR